MVSLAKKKSLPRIFPGWWIVLATGFVTFWGHGYYTQGFSALFKPISADLGLSRAVTSVAASIGRFEGGFEAPITGWFTDRYGPRWVIVFGTFLMGLGLVLMWFVNSLWSFYLVWGGLVGTGLNVGLAIPMDKAIANWFVKRRGTALSVRAVMQGLATIAVLPLIALLLSSIGWRTACVFGGVVMWLVGLPLVWFFIKKERPEYYGLLPDGATAGSTPIADRERMISKGVEYAAHAQEFEFTLRQAMKSRAYWLLTLAWSATNLVTAPLMVHFMPFLTDLGVDPVRAALMMATASAIAIPTRLLGGFLADRASKEQLRLIPACSFVVIVIGIVLFLLNQTLVMAYVFLIMFYIGFTTSIPLYSAIRARYFGRKSIGSIQGSAALIMMPFGVIAPVYAGWIYDRSGNYNAAFTLFAVLLGVAIVVLLFARPPKPPVEAGDIRKIL